MASRHGKTALFIDGANFHATGQALGIKIDFKRLLKEFQGAGTLIRAFYFMAVSEEDDFISIRPLLDWLDFNGYAVVTKRTKEFVDASGRRKTKGNMDVEIAVGAMDLARHVDQIVLFSGDGAFCPLVAALQRLGVRVSVVSSISSSPPMISGELRRQADTFVDLQDLRKKIEVGRHVPRPPAGV